VNGGVVEPTGVRVTINGMTVAEFAGAQICSIRQYWDELAVFEQLGLLSGG
jgi:ketosteroid isomerase-like protein